MKSLQALLNKRQNQTHISLYDKEKSTAINAVKYLNFYQPKIFSV